MGLLLRVYYDQASYSPSLLYSDVKDEKPTAFNAQLARLGLRAFLKMVLEDNFAHSDLHPGNIIVCRLASCLFLSLSPQPHFIVPVGEVLVTIRLV